MDEQMCRWNEGCGMWMRMGMEMEMETESRVPRKPHCPLAERGKTREARQPPERQSVTPQHQQQQWQQHQQQQNQHRLLIIYTYGHSCVDASIYTTNAKKKKVRQQRK